MTGFWRWCFLPGATLAAAGATLPNPFLLASTKDVWEKSKSKGGEGGKGWSTFLPTLSSESLRQIDGTSFIATNYGSLNVPSPFSASGRLSKAWLSHGRRRLVIASGFRPLSKLCHESYHGGSYR